MFVLCDPVSTIRIGDRVIKCSSHSLRDLPHKHACSVLTDDDKLVYIQWGDKSETVLADPRNKAYVERLRAERDSQSG
jgi:acetyl-CoA carboxylase beta subunit